MTYQRRPVTGAGVSPAGRWCLLAASLTLVLLPLIHLSASTGPKRSGSEQLPPATHQVVAAEPVPEPRTANDRALADIRRRLDLIDARIAAERIAEHASSADEGPALPGDTSLAGPGPAPALAVTTGDTLQHDTAVQVRHSQDFVAAVPAGNRQRPAVSPD
jgi:hypothetical protein